MPVLRIGLLVYSVSYVAHTGLELTMYSPVRPVPWTPVSSSQVLGLQLWVTMLGCLVHSGY